MKKILLICDGDNFPAGAVPFIHQIRDSEPVYVKGMFFTPADALEMIPVGFIPVAGPYMKLKENEQIKVHESQQRFAKALENAGIKYDIQPYEGAWDINLFKTESRFADLVVVSGELFYKDALEGQPNFFMSQALRLSECPVLVIPENFITIERLAIAYDGEKESMHAAKQFIYLFPDLADLPTEIVHANEEAKEDIPNRDLLREFTFSHFQAQYTSKLPFNPKKYFGTWLEERKNVLLVTGSFSRSSFSNQLKQSFAEKIIKDHNCPVFIAHL